MGLDHSITVMKEKTIRNEYGENEVVLEPRNYLFRKVNPLQGYFETHYNTENCVRHSIRMEDIAIIKDHTDYILQNKDDITYIEDNLPPTAGFFYGSHEIDEYYFNNIQEMNDVMHEILNEIGITALYYDCWY